MNDVINVIDVMCMYDCRGRQMIETPPNGDYDGRDYVECQVTDSR